MQHIHFTGEAIAMPRQQPWQAVWRACSAVCSNLVYCSGHCSAIFRPYLESFRKHHHEPWQLPCALAQGLLAHKWYPFCAVWQVNLP